jgi:hypothetical protein
MLPSCSAGKWHTSSARSPISGLTDEVLFAAPQMNGRAIH